MITTSGIAEPSGATVAATVAGLRFRSTRYY